MSVDVDEAALLAAARRGLSPTAADRARVHHAITNALGVGSGASAGAGATSARPLRWASRALLVGAVGALSASAGYRAGLRAGGDLERSTRGPGAVPPSASAPQASAAAPTPAPSMAGSVTVVAPAAPPATRRRANPDAADAADAPPAPAASLAEEVRALRSIERALRDGNPGFALALLRELDRAVPNGRLVEERLATRVIARCATGDVPFGVNLADDFVGRYPDSVYGRRVADACAATDSPRSGDPRTRRSSHDED